MTGDWKFQTNLRAYIESCGPGNFSKRPLQQKNLAHSMGHVKLSVHYKERGQSTNGGLTL